MQELKELIASYQTLRESGRGPAICATIIETARQCNLDKDIRLPDADPKELSLEGRDTVVGQVYSKCGAPAVRRRTGWLSNTMMQRAAHAGRVADCVLSAVGSVGAQPQRPDAPASGRARACARRLRAG